MVRHPDHVTIAVRDPEAAVAFFAVLGFVRDHVAEIDGGVPAAYMGMPSMHADHITLVLDGADPRFEIQLLHFHQPAPEASFAVERASHFARVGLNHLALRVDDLAATREHLVAHGVRSLGDEMDYIGRRLQLFEGPDGVTIELVEAR